MSARNRFAACLFAVVLLFSVAAPAAAGQAATAELSAPRITLSTIWNWFAGLLVPHTDEAKGQITPEGTSGDMTPPQDPLAAPSSELIAPDSPVA